MGFTPGAIVAGRYRLVALLGKGGMGEVYRGEDLTLDQPVALKFLPEGVAANDARLPPLRPWRRRRPPLPDDGVRGRRGSVVVVAAVRADAAGQGDPDRAAALC